MTTSLQTDPRRTARDAFRKPGRPPLEMPVLFQLADLSVHSVRLAPASPPPVAEPTIALPVVAAPHAPIAELALAKVTPEAEVPMEQTSAQAATAVETLVADVESVQPRPDPIVTLAAMEAVAPAAAIAVEPPREVPASATDEELAECITTPTAGSVTSATDVTPPTETTAPSPRARADQRSKNRQSSPAHSDWMRTHGKYIAIAFVFGLIATIYLAQNGDEPTPANPEAASTTNAEAEARTPSESEPKVTDAHAAKESVPVAHHHHSSTFLDESNPAAENPAADAHAELHAPRGGNTIREPAPPTEIADSQSLFPWKEAGETRVASKPEEPRAKSPAEPRVNEPPLRTNDETPPREPASEEVQSIYGPPGSQPPEPATGQPVSEDQGLNPPTRDQATNPNRYREFEPPPSRAPAQPQVSSPGATPASFQPGSKNIAPPSRTSGPRYERTGSGLY